MEANVIRPHIGRRVYYGDHECRSRSKTRSAPEAERIDTAVITKACLAATAKPADQRPAAALAPCGARNRDAAC